MEENPTANVVTLYGHEACPQCKVSILALNAAGITFQYRNVRQDPAAKDYIEKLGYSSVPVTEANGDHWYGFLPDRIKALATSTKSPALQGSGASI